MKFRLPVLEKDKAYIGASLFLPRGALDLSRLRTALAFSSGPEDEARELLRLHKHHYEVPRNFLTRKQLSDLGIEVVDLRPTTFAATSLRPKPNFAFRPHQELFWPKMAAAKETGEDFVLRLNTGRGKTIMALAYAALLGGPVLVTAAQEAHLRDWERKMREYFELDGEVGWVLRDKMDYKRDVVMATVQTLVKRAEAGALPPDFHTHFALVIYDEAHHLAAQWFSRSLDLTWGQRLSLTATLTRRDRCEGIVLYHSGKVLYDDPGTDALVPSVHVWETGTVIAEDDPSVIDVTGMPNVSKLRTRLSREEDRNWQIVQVIRQRVAEGRVVFVVSHIKEHVYRLVELIEAELGVSCGTLTGDEKDAERRLQELNNYQVVVSTLYVGKENYDRPDIGAVVLVTPLSVDDYAPTEWVQTTGRAARPVPGKLPPVVDVFNDRGVEFSSGLLQTVLAWCRKNNWKITWEGRKWVRSK